MIKNDQRALFDKERLFVYTYPEIFSMQNVSTFLDLKGKGYVFFRREGTTC